VGRSRDERFAGPPGDVSTNEDPPPRVLLVDDVLTTGATIAACAAALKRAGAREITALTYARTPAR
jgi:predicted amidophosphoribosyltransferase